MEKKEQFKCTHCNKRFDIENRGYFSFSQGNVCRDCWRKWNKERDVEERKDRLERKRRVEKYKEKQRIDFEKKVRKIVNQVLDERTAMERKN